MARQKFSVQQIIINLLIFLSSFLKKQKFLFHVKKDIKQHSHPYPTYLYPYHNDNSFGLLALHLLHSKAHIGYLSDLNAMEMRTWHNYIVLVHYMTDTIHGMFCMFVLMSHNIACSDILYIVHLRAYNVLDMLCMRVVQLLRDK